MGKQTWTKEFYLNKMKEIHQDKYTYIIPDGKFRAYTYVRVICNNCKHEFLQRANSGTVGYGCKKCANRMNSRTQEDFIKFSALTHDNKYDYSKTVYINNRIKVEIICPEHGSFLQGPKDHSNGHGCPMCVRSELEEFVVEYLQTKNIRFVEQKTFDGLRRTLPLRVDFFLLDKFALEINGHLHYRNTRDPERFKVQQDIDKIKEEFFTENNIPYLVIPFWDFNVDGKVASKIDRFIRGETIPKEQLPKKIPPGRKSNNRKKGL